MTARDVIAKSPLYGKMVLRGEEWFLGDHAAGNLITALSAAGLAIVPIKPTEAMRIAGLVALMAWLKPLTDEVTAEPNPNKRFAMLSVRSDTDSNAIYSAMLEASTETT